MVAVLMTKIFTRTCHISCLSSRHGALTMMKRRRADCARRHERACASPTIWLHMPGRPARLDVLLEVALEAAVQDLALAGLQAVHHARDGPFQVRAREQDQLLCAACAHRQSSSRAARPGWSAPGPHPGAASAPCTVSVMYGRHAGPCALHTRRWKLLWCRMRVRQLVLRCTLAPCCSVVSSLREPFTACSKL